MKEVDLTVYNRWLTVVVGIVLVMSVMLIFLSSIPKSKKQASDCWLAIFDRSGSVAFTNRMCGSYFENITDCEILKNKCTRTDGYVEQWFDSCSWNDESNACVCWPKTAFGAKLNITNLN